ncbi:hypothetical protein BKA70DRAFT_1228108 [Coprinopsis sp. MPI-PUGE-AT-0042]|nr:hypothetical protein BKA70DRAFT_1228108 [Coprinopsis sp. MPI-PUGE-AT-0042]
MNRMFPFISRNTTSVPSRPDEGFRDTPDPIDDNSDTSTNAQAHAPVSSAIPFGESASASQSSLVSRPSSATRRRSTRPSEDPGVKCRIVARNDPWEQEAMAKVLERLTAMESQDQKLTTQHKLLGEYQEKLENQTLELKECQEKLEHALQAQRTNEGLIEALRKEIAEKSREIDVLKEDIRVRDGKISELSVNCANRIVEVEEEAHAKVNESRSREAAAQEQLEELRKAAEKADMVEENRPQDRMDTDDGMRDGREGQSQDDDRMDTNSLQAEGGYKGIGRATRFTNSPPQEHRYPSSQIRSFQVGFGPEICAGNPSLVDDCFPTVDDCFAIVDDCFRTIDDCFSIINDCFSIIDDGFSFINHQLVPLIKAVVAELTGGSSKQRPPPMAHAFQKRVDLNLLASTAATEDEDAIADFEAGEGEEPPLVPLKPCWSTLKSEWNAMLARKFVEYMVSEVGMDEKWKETMDEMFLDRLKRQRALLRANSHKEGEDEEAWVGRVKSRKGKVDTRDRLFKKRRLISSEARDDPEEAKAWDEIDRVVEELGAGGMSSDESEYDEYEKKAAHTNIRSLPWQAEGIEELMKIIDRDAVNSTAGGFQRGGNPGLTRVRKLAPVASRRLAMRGLPRNYYDEDWLNQLPPRQKKALGALDPRPLPELKKDE